MGIHKNDAQEKKDARGGKTTKKKWLAFEDMVFVDYDMTKSDRETCKEWAVTGETLFDLMEGAVASGYKITILYDSARTCAKCQVLATLDVEDKSQVGYCLTARGSTSAKAFKQAMWIMTKVCGGDLTTLDMSRADNTLDD